MKWSIFYIEVSVKNLNLIIENADLSAEENKSYSHKDYFSIRKTSLNK